MNWPRLRPPDYQRRLADIHDQYHLAEIKREKLILLGRHALEDAEALSVSEEAIIRQPCASAERYQYLVDAVTHALGQLITDLVRCWAEQD